MASASAPANKIERAHQMYRDGHYEEALGYYTEALAVAKTKYQKIALHSNRAACFLKLHNFKKAAEECTSVLELDHKHTGALMLRAQTLVTLKEYNSALFDVNRLLELNPLSEVYQNLHGRLKTQLGKTTFLSSLSSLYFSFVVITLALSISDGVLVEGKSLAPIPEAEAEIEEDEEDTDEPEPKEDEKEVGEKVAAVGSNPSVEFEGDTPNTEVSISQTLHFSQKAENGSLPPSLNESSKQQSVRQEIPKPKGHSLLDYSRWDKVEDDSSEDDDDEDEEESQPQYRFRVRTVGVRPVK
ncbi:hypothetical protein RJ639_000868 [Escallonia herrerae]|uniref:Tetratricopeptide repeat protein n=1 Tax=Escallonia herrerae TaxID=1293975 RepID=A0AA89BSS0_9ASTE|nr:hypothetical protein RJ639_000868 [Escallonia herrerae]